MSVLPQNPSLRNHFSEFLSSECIFWNPCLRNPFFRDPFLFSESIFSESLFSESIFSEFIFGIHFFGIHSFGTHFFGILFFRINFRNLGKNEKNETFGKWLCVIFLWKRCTFRNSFFREPPILAFLFFWVVGRFTPPSTFWVVVCGEGGLAVKLILVGLWGFWQENVCGCVSSSSRIMTPGQKKFWGTQYPTRRNDNFMSLNLFFECMVPTLQGIIFGNVLNNMSVSVKTHPRDLIRGTFVRIREGDQTTK